MSQSPDPVAAAMASPAGPLPGSGELEGQAASLAGALDPAWIEGLANSLFRGGPGDLLPFQGANLPSAPVYAGEPLAGVEPGTARAARVASPNLGPTSADMPSAGATLPSAPVFAAEPYLASAPGAPNASAPLSPNVTPGSFGVPMPGASMPSAPVYAPEQLKSVDPAAPAASAAVMPPVEKGGAGSVPGSNAAFPSAGPPLLPSGAQLPQSSPWGEADLASVPSRLGGSLAIIPPLAAADLPFGGSGLPTAFPAAPGASAPSAEIHAFEPPRAAGAPSVVEPSAQTGAVWPQTAASSYAPNTPAGGLSPASLRESYYFIDEGLSASTRANPWAAPLEGQSADLAALPSQHRPELELPPISGVRQFDAHIFRRDFPILHEYVNGRPLIWLDNAATTQKPQAVIDRLAYFYARENSNVHRAAHALAARSTDAFEAARQKVRRFLNAPSDDNIVWVRGTTEAINLVAKAWGGRNVGEGDEVVITNLEHHSNIVPWQMLCTEKGAKLRVAPVDDRGEIILEEYERLLNPRTRMVAFTHVSNALGTIAPVLEMVEMAHRHGARVLVDGAQAVSHMPVDVQTLGADFYVFSGHKVFGPTGVGALYGKAEELEAMPPWQGGGSMIKDVTFEKSVYQEPPEKFEAGTGTIADAVGLGAAIDYVEQIGMSNIAAYEHTLINYALEGLHTVPGLKLIGTPRERAGAISFVLDECRVEDVGAALNQEGIAVRAGHHCAQPILRRFGQETTVRPSFALYNTPEDVDALVAALHKIAARRGRRGF